MKMSVRYCLKVVVIGCLCGIISAGCRTGRGKKGAGIVGGERDLAPGEEEFVLSERFVEGRRVTDVIFRNVQFKYDSYQIGDYEVSKIEEVADYMRRNSRANLICEGHCDERGSRVYNMSLGESRAHAVRAYLIGLNIESSRIQTRSYGEEKPLNAGHGESIWQLNRRVEFVLYR